MTSPRIERLRKEMKVNDLDALLVLSLPNIRYLSGFSGSHALCIVTHREAHFVTDGRYALQSGTEVKGFSRTITLSGLFDGAARKQLLKGCRRVGFESHHLSYGHYRSLKRLFPSASLVPTTEVIENLALVKGRVEIAAMRKAAAISDRAFAEILASIQPGVRERDIAAEISYRQRKHGADRDAFEPIVASGRRGCLPHAGATRKRVRSGELVTLDFGCVVRGYHSDLTRTVAVGQVTKKLREIYNVVLDAQQAALREAKGGMWAKELDAAARERIRAAGYGRYFVHGLGHGIGLRLHERPRVSALSKERLLPGSVVTIEPGVYISAVGGARIEDEALLTPTGCRVLTKAPKELIIL